MQNKEAYGRKNPYQPTPLEFFRYGQLPTFIDGLKHTLRAKPLFPNMSILALAAMPQTAAIMEQVVREQAPESQRDERRIIEAVRSMKRYEDQIGNRSITFTEASNYVSIVAHFVKEATGFPDKATDLLNRTYIIEGSRREELNIPKDIPALERPAIAKLKENYPHFYLTEEIARNVFSGFHQEGIAQGGLIPHIGIFLFLDNINNWTTRSTRVQFMGDENNLTCAVTSPIAYFRYVLLHEMFHEISLPHKFTPLEQDMVVFGYDMLADRGIFPERSDSVAFGTLGFGLIARIRPANSDFIAEVALREFNEFATDYLALRLMNKWGLSYPEGPYSSPHDMFNFQRILQQSGISDDELLNHYHNGELRKFILRVGRGAQHPTLDPSADFETEDELLSYFLRRLAGMKTDTPRWKELQLYFPKLRGNKHNYTIPRKHENPRDFVRCDISLAA